MLVCLYSYFNQQRSSFSALLDYQKQNVWTLILSDIYKNAFTVLE